MEQQILVLDPSGADHHAQNAELRERGPAALVDLLGIPAWAVTDPEVLRDLLTDPRVSKDAYLHWPLFPGEAVDRWPLKLWVAVRNMFTAYGEEHRRLRRLVSPAFTARRMDAMVPRIAEITAELLDDLAATPPGGTVDLRDRFAHPLPMRVISELMGLPEHSRPGFRRTVEGVFDTTLTAEQATANTQELYGILKDLVAAKRAEPGDDMTSVLIAARDEEGDGSALTEEELVDTLLLVISAGFETTVNLLDQAVTALLTHPEQLGHVRAGRAGWSDVVEEALRFEAPVAHLPLRYAVEDIALPGGPTIRRGEAIIASFAAANRHEKWHGDTAEVFDVTRSSKKHLSFGHGVHVCLGAALARAEATTALPALFDRFPDLRLAVPAGELRPTPGLIANGHQSLPVRLA
ncbi:cytochrome P450 [Streptomyces carminius]|uniref:Cytochrome P450 n=1 Tax=Streptomyces carminius TaxID=2665496 RepID=A0A2M8M5T4_9ACTN|nr:cytochrome P450 [Streptomyces carminius]PJE99563.1 cytochrome P450 [Streptomyces carminius]